MKRGYFSSSAVALVLAVLVVAARGTGTGLLRASAKTLHTPGGRKLPAPADYKQKTDVWPTPSESVSPSALPEEVHTHAWNIKPHGKTPTPAQIRKLIKKERKSWLIRSNSVSC